MGLAVGKNRIALIFPPLGVVVKIAIVRVFGAIIYEIKQWLWRRRDIEEYSVSQEIAISLGGRETETSRSLLLRGIDDNWQEYLFSIRTKHPLLKRTYYSLFGLINIQKLGVPCTFENEWFWAQLCSISDGGVFEDVHHMKNPDNFSLDGDGFTLLDYGSPKTQAVVLAHGSSLREHFDVNWVQPPNSGSLPALRAINKT